MPGALLHSPADVIRQLLVDMDLGLDYEDAKTSWAAFASGEPDLPDDCITVYDTDGRQNGRDMVGGERNEHAGFQIRVRARDHATGHGKARQIAVAIDEGVNNVQVDLEGNGYLIYAITRTGGVLALGKDAPNSKRSLFTINGVASLRQTTSVGTFFYLTEDREFGWELEDGSGFYLLEL